MLFESSRKVIGIFITNHAGNINNSFVAFKDLNTGKLHTQVGYVFENALTKSTSEQRHQLIGINPKPLTQFFQGMIFQEGFIKMQLKFMRQLQVVLAEL